MVQGHAACASGPRLCQDVADAMQDHTGIEELSDLVKSVSQCYGDYMETLGVAKTLRDFVAENVEKSELCTTNEGVVSELEWLESAASFPELGLAAAAQREAWDAKTKVPASPEATAAVALARDGFIAKAGQLVAAAAAVAESPGEMGTNDACALVGQLTIEIEAFMKENVGDHYNSCLAAYYNCQLRKTRMYDGLPPSTFFPFEAREDELREMAEHPVANEKNALALAEALGHKSDATFIQITHILNVIQIGAARLLSAHVAASYWKQQEELQTTQLYRVVYDGTKLLASTLERY